jgi:hypothetical protein
MSKLESAGKLYQANYNDILAFYSFRQGILRFYPFISMISNFLQYIFRLSKNPIFAKKRDESDNIGFRSFII